MDLGEIPPTKCMQTLTLKFRPLIGLNNEFVQKCTVKIRYKKLKRFFRNESLKI